ncbi:winged helix-turn-helix domain-containing protein [Halobacteria archaeon AArc-m2/3/4]|uniref:Winged helix-turn-helix domain-containing protein n=1 Tax=Natronoglomus mannanivorans TaxID=2979990 RepID=A0ABT2Q8A4_9EURY|nr:winged helix-turn-helix domain-containing protein [Halobacteria archaeon AArc-m2/3/4]
MSDHLSNINDTDEAILTILSDGRRQNQTNIAKILSKETTYVRDRLSYLKRNGLVERVGPSERSGLYEISPAGRAKLRLNSLPEGVHGMFNPNENGDPTGQSILIHPSPLLFAILERVQDESIPSISDIATYFTTDHGVLEYVIESAERQHLIKRDLREIKIEGITEPDEKEVLELTELGEQVLRVQARWGLYGDRALSASIHTWDRSHLSVENWIADQGDITHEQIEQWVNSFKVGLTEPEGMDMDLSVKFAEPEDNSGDSE